MKRGNLFADTQAPPTGERFDSLLAHRNLVVERIVSSSSSSPAELVQAQDEWVVLLRGEAIIEVADERVALASGDYVFLPAGVRHAVTSTSDGALWLAVHLHPQVPGGDAGRRT